MVKHDIPSVVPAECIEYFRPDRSMSRCTSATWADTEGEDVPIYSLCYYTFKE